MEGLKPGRIVYYVLGEVNIAEIQQRRSAGLQHGNPLERGDIVPAMVVRVWSDDGCCNLKCMLDGDDTYWVTSAQFDESKQPYSWHWMFEGQRTRYQPDRVEVPSTPSQG